MRCRSTALRTALGMLALLFTGCGGGATVIVTTPTPDQAAEPVEVPPLAGSLPIASPTAEWTPRMYGGEEGAMLASALSDTSPVMMLLGARADAAFEDRVFQMIKAAAPDIEVVARARGALDKLLEERGEIPYRVTLQPGGTDILGRPFYLPKEHPLTTEWLTKKEALKGAGGMLTVRPVKVGDQKLRELRGRSRGDCTAALGELRAAVEESAAFFTPFTDGANAALEVSFQRHLSAALPFWREELAALEERVAPGGEDARCVAGYEKLFDAIAPCVDRSCELAPRIRLVRGGLVGADRAPLELLPDSCPTEGIRDYRVEIEELYARVVDEVLPSLSGPWAAELQRMEGLSRIASGLEDACTLRHRRLSLDDLTLARTEVKAFLDKLGERELHAEWYPSGGLERVPGVGPVTVLARVRAVGADPAAEAADLTERLRRLDRCDQGGERTYQATVIDVGSSEVVFMGIFFEEQLLCEDLPPGQP